MLEKSANAYLEGQQKPASVPAESLTSQFEFWQVDGVPGYCESRLGRGAIY
jgi:hypothetical protein